MVGIQIRMARLALGLTASQLAKRAKVSLATLNRAEAAGFDPPPITVLNLVDIQRALEAEGVTFVDDGQPSLGGGLGIRIQRRAASA